MLTSIISKIVTGLLSALAGWLVRHFQEIIKDAKQNKEDEAASQKAVDADKAAVTPQERDSAAQDIASNL